MARRKSRKAAPKARFRPQARAGSKLSEMLDEIATGPEHEFRALRRPADARFEAREATDQSVAEIDVYDIIGSWECNAATMRAALREITARRIVVNINSPGGSVFDGFAMFSDLRNHPAHVHVRINGLAASAASVLAMAGDTIEIAENGFLMIHNAWTVAIGDAREMSATARVLGQIDNRIAKCYSNRTGDDLASIKALMDAETWMDSDDAKDAGFVDTITEAVPAQSLVHDVSKFGKAPKALRVATLQPEAQTQEQPAPAQLPDMSGIAAQIDRLAAAMAVTLPTAN